MKKDKKEKKEKKPIVVKGFVIEPKKSVSIILNGKRLRKCTEEFIVNNTKDSEPTHTLEFKYSGLSGPYKPVLTPKETTINPELQERLNKFDLDFMTALNDNRTVTEGIDFAIKLFDKEVKPNPLPSRYKSWGEFALDFLPKEIARGYAYRREPYAKEAVEFSYAEVLNNEFKELFNIK